MQQDQLIIPPTTKIYNDRAIYVGTFLGGPLIAGYFAAENFKHLGQASKVSSAWLAAICGTAVIVAAAFLIPNIEMVPNYVIPLLYTGVAQWLVKKYQGKAITSHLDAGGKAFSTWRAVGIGLVGLLILLVLTFIIIFLTDNEFFN